MRAVAPSHSRSVPRSRAITSSTYPVDEVLVLSTRVARGGFGVSDRFHGCRADSNEHSVSPERVERVPQPRQRRRSKLKVALRPENVELGPDFLSDLVPLALKVSGQVEAFPRLGHRRVDRA